VHRLVLWANLFWGFFQVGVLGFGGGPGSVGIIQAVTVESYRWLTPDEFAQVLAVGNSLPGPLATKMAGCPRQVRFPPWSCTSPWGWRP
jgi:chromate transporter